MWIRSGRLICAGAAAVTVFTAALAGARTATDTAESSDDPSRHAATEAPPEQGTEAVQHVNERGVNRDGGSSPGSAVTFPSLPSITVPPGCPASDSSSESSVGAVDVLSARGDHEAGMVLFRQDRYMEAIDLWKRSYFKQCSAHMLLYNISIAYERLGHFHGALQYFEAYTQRAGMALAPDESQAAGRRLRDLQLKTRIADLSFEAARRFASVGAGSPDDRPERSSTNAISASSRSSRRSVRRSEPEVAGSRSDAGLWSWVVIVSGAAACVGGGVAWTVGAKTISDVEKKCGSDRACEHDDDVDQGNRGRQVRNAGVVSVAAGAGLLIGGLTWYLIGGRASPLPRSSFKRSVTLVPEASVHGGALRVEASF